jgi:heme/copper-type cytochrome/quinol oxidase subunit 2
VIAAGSSGHQGIFDALVALHVVSAVVGFGSVAISGVYGATARHADRAESSEETRRYFQSPGRAEWLIVAVPFFGLAALGFRPEGAHLGQLWVVAGTIVWLVAAALLLVVVRPSEREIRLSTGDPPPVRAGRRLMWASIASDVLFVVALAVMVAQPA